MYIWMSVNNFQAVIFKLQFQKKSEILWTDALRLHTETEWLNYQAFQMPSKTLTVGGRAAA